MRLKSYLEREKLSYGRFAELIGASTGKVVHRYVVGHQIPNRHFMLRIFEITGGEVTPDSFYLPPDNGEEAA